MTSEDAVWVGEELQKRFRLPYWQFALSATDGKAADGLSVEEVVGLDLAPVGGDGGAVLVLPASGGASRLTALTEKPHHVARGEGRDRANLHSGRPPFQQ